MLGVALLGVLACGDDDSSPARGTKHKDGGEGLDAATDAAMDAEIEQPPITPVTPPDAGKHDPVVPVKPTPDAGPDAAVVAPPTCADLDCASLSDECNVVTCNPVSVKCVVKPRADDTPCGSQVLDNCSAPDRCMAGVCEPRHAAAGTACGVHDDCRVDDTCDGEGNCVDNGLAAEDTPCGEQTPSDPDCDAPDTCDADGVCQPRYTDANTSCGDKDVACHYDDKCNGFGSCEDGGLWEIGACPNGEEDGQCVCGRTDQTFCHPQKDLCDAGTCVLGSIADGTACGNPTPTHAVCDHPDSCFDGMCSPNPTLAGTACGDQSTNTTCDRRDACDGGGNCDPNYAGTDVVCGSAPDLCGDERHCSGGGACNTAAFKAAGTVCGSAMGVCYLERKCNGGAYTCPMSLPAPPGAACGNPNAIDPTCDAPDSCDGSGVCDPNHETPGTTCGSQATSDCSVPDTCDNTGACNPNNLPAGTDCGDQGLACLNDDSCNASGVCVDNGYDSPCGLNGRVTADNVAQQNITVKVTGAGATMATTDVNGEFTLNAPLGQEVLLSTTGAPGYYGQVNARTFTRVDVGQSLELSLAGDAEVEGAATALSDTQDADKGVVLLSFTGTDLDGSEGAMISASSDPPIADANGNYQRSNTIVTPGSAGAIFFYNVAVGTTTVTPINGLATTCHRVSSLSNFLVQAHTVTFVDITCN